MNRSSSLRVSTLDLTALCLHEEDGHQNYQRQSPNLSPIPSQPLQPMQLQQQQQQQQQPRGLSRQRGWGSAQTRQAYSSLVTLDSSTSLQSCYMPSSYSSSSNASSSPNDDGRPPSSSFVLDDHHHHQHDQHYDSSGDHNSTADQWGFFVDVKGSCDAASPFG